MCPIRALCALAVGSTLLGSLAIPVKHRDQGPDPKSWGLGPIPSRIKKSKTKQQQKGSSSAGPSRHHAAQDWTPTDLSLSMPGPAEHTLHNFFPSNESATHTPQWPSWQHAATQSPHSTLHTASAHGTAGPSTASGSTQQPATYYYLYHLPQLSREQQERQVSTILHDAHTNTIQAGMDRLKERKRYLSDPSNAGKPLPLELMNAPMRRQIESRANLLAVRQYAQTVPPEHRSRSVREFVDSNINMFELPVDDPQRLQYQQTYGRAKHTLKEYWMAQHRGTEHAAPPNFLLSRLKRRLLESRKDPLVFAAKSAAIKLALQRRKEEGQAKKQTSHISKNDVDSTSKLQGKSSLQQGEKGKAAVLNPSTSTSSSPSRR